MSPPSFFDCSSVTTGMLSPIDLSVVYGATGGKAEEKVALSATFQCSHMFSNGADLIQMEPKNYICLCSRHLFLWQGFSPKA